MGSLLKCVWVTAAPQVMWSTDSVRVFTVDGGWGLDLRGGGTTETPSAWAGRCASVRGGLTGCPRGPGRAASAVAANSSTVGSTTNVRLALQPRRRGTTATRRGFRTGLRLNNPAYNVPDVAIPFGRR